MGTVCRLPQACGEPDTQEESEELYVVRFQADRHGLLRTASKSLLMEATWLEGLSSRGDVSSRASWSKALAMPFMSTIFQKW